LHIGTGRELLQDYDYAVFGKKTWVINQAALLDAKSPNLDPAWAARLAVTPPADLLEDADFAPGQPWVRYVIGGTPRSLGEGIQVLEQFKNVFDQPYLPGSSLKGALRTLVGWQAWKDMEMSPDASRLKDNPKFAASNLEAEIFGRNPNNDSLRALQVSDSEPVGTEHLMLLNARVLNPGGKLSAPVVMEAVRPDVTFCASLKLDSALFSGWARRYGLQLNHESLLTKLPEIASAHAREQIEQELDWLGPVRGTGNLRSAYETFRKATLEPGQFLLRLGWGTGWDDKTFGDNLKDDDDFMEYIIHHYRMSKGKREAGDLFPRSRRAAVSITRGADGGLVETPATPLGWVLVEMKAR